MSSCRVLVKYSMSKCNKDLLEFLIRNVDVIRKRCSLQVLVVYDENITMLKGKVSKLPALIMGGRVITGNSAIRKMLLPPVGPAQAAAQKDTGSSDLQEYWSQEMHANDDNEDDEDGVMEKVKHAALGRSIQHQEQHAKKKPKKREPVTTDNNIAMADIQGASVADLETDPYMAMFWANQETTPGM